MGEVSIVPHLKQVMRWALVMRDGRRLWGQSKSVSAAEQGCEAAPWHFSGSPFCCCPLLFFSKRWSRHSGNRNAWWLLSQAMPTLSPCAVIPRAGLLAGGTCPWEQALLYQPQVFSYPRDSSAKKSLTGREPGEMLCTLAERSAWCRYNTNCCDGAKCCGQPRYDQNKITSSHSRFCSPPWRRSQSLPSIQTPLRGRWGRTACAPKSPRDPHLAPWGWTHTALPWCPAGSRSPAGRRWLGWAAALQGMCSVPLCMEVWAQGNLLAGRVGGSPWECQQSSWAVLTVAMCCSCWLPASVGRWWGCLLCTGQGTCEALKTWECKGSKGGAELGPFPKETVVRRRTLAMLQGGCWRGREVGGEVMDWNGKKPLRGWGKTSDGTVSGSFALWKFSFVFSLLSFSSHHLAEAEKSACTQAVSFCVKCIKCRWWTKVCQPHLTKWVLELPPTSCGPCWTHLCLLASCTGNRGVGAKLHVVASSHGAVRLPAAQVCL